MAEYKKAFVIGGWSEDLPYIDGLSQEISEGRHRFVDEADSITLGWALANGDKLAQEAKRRIVIAHSSAPMAIRESGIIVTLNGAEPTLPHLSIFGGLRTACNRQIGYDESVPAPNLLNSVRELLRSPRTLAVPGWLVGFSTVKLLLGNKESFPDGRVYLAYDKDEYGFGQHGEIELARADGMVADMLEGWHNQPMQHPVTAARDIKASLDELG